MAQLLLKKNSRRIKDSKGDMVFNFFVCLFCTLIFLIVAYPLYFVVIASFSDATMVQQGKAILAPAGFTLEGYRRVFNDVRIWNGYINTIIIAIGSTAVHLFFEIQAAYALSRREFIPRRVINVIFVITMYVGGGLIPTYLLVTSLGFYDSITALIFPHCVSVWNCLILRTSFMNSSSQELYEAACIDGASHYRFLVQILIPLSKAVICVLMLYGLVGSWNSYFGALMYIPTEAKQPLQMVLRRILLQNQALQTATMGEMVSNFAMETANQIKYAVLIVSSVPLLILYPFLQKYFEKGVMLGSVKG